MTSPVSARYQIAVKGGGDGDEDARGDVQEQPVQLRACVVGDLAGGVYVGGMDRPDVAKASATSSGSIGASGVVTVWSGMTAPHVRAVRLIAAASEPMPGWRPCEQRPGAGEGELSLSGFVL
ncbi:hypothetical protein GCM10017752_00160 [Streptomyces roseoviridis]